MNKKDKEKKLQKLITFRNECKAQGWVDRHELEEILKESLWQLEKDLENKRRGQEYIERKLFEEIEYNINILEEQIKNDSDSNDSDTD